MFIEDGTGKGYKAKVNKENLLLAEVVQLPLEHHINEEYGEAYSLVVSKTPAATGDNCFCYIKNTSDYDLAITTAKLYAATDESIQVKLGDSGTPVGGTTTTPVNRNAGSGHTADATCETGTDITGLSGGSVVDDIFVKGGETTAVVRWWSSLIIPKNQTLTLYAVTCEIAVKVTLTMVFLVE